MMHVNQGRTAGTCAIFLLGIAGCSGPVAPADPPGGGRTFQLDFEQFETEVSPILTRQGCDAGGDCHGGGIRGTLALSPAGAKDPVFDFDQVSLQVNGADPGMSAILQKPLAEEAGGAPHGVTVFTSTVDDDYQTILAWIESGEFQ
jgi:hypothetical protein